MAKKIVGIIKLQVPAGKANPSPPIGPALGQRGLNIMEFCKAFNAATQNLEPGMPIPVVITAFADRSFTFVTKSPPNSFFSEEGSRDREGIADNRQGARGGPRHDGADPRDCRAEDAGSQRKGYRRCLSHADWLGAFNGPRSGGVRLMAKTGKRLKKAYDGIDPTLARPLEEALKLIKERASAKFDETVEVAMNLNLDPRKPDQNLRGAVMLPHGTGKTVRVAVFARGDRAKEAEAAGADVVGAEDLAERIQAGQIDFDRAIASPDMMSLVGRLGKILGPRGLMPNPRLGTVTQNVAEAVQAAKGGQVEFRAEKAGIVHAGVGKASFTDKALADNVRAFVGAITRGKPSGVKGTYIKKVSVSSTMGPGVRVELPGLAEEPRA